MPGESIVGTPVVITDTDCTATTLAANDDINVSVFDAASGRILVTAFTGTGNITPTICLRCLGARHRHSHIDKHARFYDLC